MSGAEDWPTFFDSSTCVRKGQCPITKTQGQSDNAESHTLYFGSEQVLFIMGLNASSFSWNEQLKHFSRTGKHSVLVFDNRGVGNSSVPPGRYTTKGMAEDVIVLLDYLGWTEQFHVVGISLGGMIAQELASCINDRIISLSLCVTKAGNFSWNGITPWKGLSTLLRVIPITDLDVKVPMVVSMAFPAPWLDAKDPDDPARRTNREIQVELYKSRAKLVRPQTFMGSVSQMSAATTHRMTPDRLRIIAATIPKVLIATGDTDNLICPANSRDLAAHMPEAELVVWENTGHALNLQWPQRFNELLERTFQTGRERFEARNN